MTRRDKHGRLTPERREELLEMVGRAFGNTPRDPARIDRILGKLRKYWHENPDLRLGQLVSILTELNGAPIFYQEDDVTEKQLDDMTKRGK